MAAVVPGTRTQDFRMFSSATLVVVVVAVLTSVPLAMATMLRGLSWYSVSSWTPWLVDGVEGRFTMEDLEVAARHTALSEQVVLSGLESVLVALVCRQRGQL